MYNTLFHIKIQLTFTVKFLYVLGISILLNACGGGGSTSPLTDPLEPLADFNANWGVVGAFTDANTCVECHRASAAGDLNVVMRAPDVNGLPDPQGEDISPGSGWKHSVMAHAFDDPYFQAKMQDETTLLPQLAGDLEDKCLTCHSPMARTHAHQTNTGLDSSNCSLGDGCYRYDQALLDDHAREGVSCTLCHQIEDINLGTEASFSGHYSINSVNREIFGPYNSPVSGPMNSGTIYTPVSASHVSDSDMCATCHTLRTPTIDIDTGQATGTEFLEQSPYLEWKNSIYFSGNNGEQQCQDCHMKAPANYQTRIAVRPNGSVNTGWLERSPFPQHQMFGGNAYILEVMKTFADVLGIDATTTTAGFDDVINKTRSFLQQDSADLAITNAVQQAGQLNVDVSIINKTGHKLPSGYPSRRMWVQLIVKDAVNATLFESGSPDANGRISIDTASLAAECLAVKKQAGFDSSACFEPHRNTISDASQVPVYEEVMADTNNNLTYILLYADHVLKDNRIPPQGFTTMSANYDPDTAIIGIGADSDFNVSNGVEGSGSDTVHYQIDTGGRAGPFTVEARLLYQSIRPSFVYSMQSQVTRVDRFKIMYEQVVPTVETLATSMQQIN